MKRRNFFKATAGGIGAASILPLAGCAATADDSMGNRSADRWYNVATGTTGIPNRKKTIDCDVLVIGGGMAGISAAVSAARSGVRTVLVQDRPVLGGNASSEMRVTVNGVQGLKNNKVPRVERETGIVEEILIENWHFNPQESYPVWDHVLYNYVVRQPNLDLLMNCQAIDAKMSGPRIQSAICWQSVTETEFTIRAKQYIDCSGDGLLAAMAGAEYRTGREGKAEFNESYAPDQPDGWVMGDCIMMITKDMGKPVPFYPPAYAIPFDAEKAFKDKHRRIKQVKEGFWWIELSDPVDIIAERDHIRHDLMAFFYGVWDHIKNSGDFPEADHMALEWIGSIPGRRESRRFMGDYILNQNDMLGYRHFDDAVAYGGWSLDEHCPGGIKNLDEPASYFHEGFKWLYEIPYRCLFSRNISNLQMAGRNVSVSHIALSSTRIISTCAMMGQATGTAAALCVKKGIMPRDVSRQHINELQEQILRDDVYIPKRPAKDPNDLARKATLSAASTASGNTALLTDGVSRDIHGETHHWASSGLPAEVQLDWDEPIEISKVELKCDTNVNRKIMMHKDPAKGPEQIKAVPPEMIKTMAIEAKINGQWKQVATVENNLTRCIKTQFSGVKTNAIRLKLKETWGHPTAKLFEVRCYKS